MKAESEVQVYLRIYRGIVESFEWNAILHMHNVNFEWSHLTAKRIMFRQGVQRQILS